MPYVTEADALKHVGRARRTLAEWRQNGLQTYMQPIAGRIYHTDDLDTFAARMRGRMSPGRPRGSKNRQKGYRRD